MIVAFWDALKKYIKPIGQVLSSKPEDEKAGRFRIEGGGHVLFRPMGMQSFARAARIMVDRGAKLENAVAKLSVVPLQLTDEPWVGVLWNASTKTMVLKYTKLTVNLFLYMVEEKLDPRTYDILKTYREVLGKPQKLLPKI
jgi:DNA sulfur modification protein DndB